MIPSISIPQIARELVQLSMQIGGQFAFFSSSPALEIRPNGSRATLDEMGSNYIDSLAAVFAELSTTQQTFQRLIGEVHKLHSLGHPICQDALLPQMDEIRVPLHHCVFQANSIVDSLFESIDLLFRDTLTHLQTYRESRKIEHWAKFCSASKHLRTWTMILIAGDRSKGMRSFFEKCAWPLPPHQIPLLNTIKHHSRFLSVLANDDSKEGGFLRTLDLHLERNEYHDKNVEYYKRHVNCLEKSARQALDVALYFLSEDQYKQSRQEWMTAHRYDDLTLFRRAYLQMTSKECTPPLNPAEAKLFYTHLHQYASGPPTAQPDAWAKQELPYLLSLIPEVVRLMRDTRTP